MSNFTFGTPSALPGFGAQPAQNPTNTGISFGAAPTQGALPTLGTGNFNFNAPAVPTTSAPTFSFGNPPAPAATSLASSGAPTLSFNTGGLGGNLSSLSASSTVPTLAGLGGNNLTFGKNTAVTTATNSFNFGTPSNQLPQNYSLGGAPALGKPIGISAAITTTAATTTTFVGLGGVDVSATQPKPGDNKPNNVKVKETLVPDEIAKTVEALKSYIKTQKQLSSDISRTSTSKLSNVNGEIAKMQYLLREIANSVESNYNQIKLLRKESSKTIQSLEIAQRTQDTPAGLQYENTAPFQYFQDLVAKYEQDLINIRQQIALTERHMHSITSPQTVTPEDLKRCFQQINESFISLAGRVHEVHQKVEAQKEQFLSLRKYRLRDNSNVFAKLEEPETKAMQTSTIVHGPSPFYHYSAMDSFGRSFASNSAAAAAVGGSTTNK